MPATRKTPQPDSNADWIEIIAAMHCPTCGHTAEDHDGDGGKGCTGCICEHSWVDILTIHVRLHSM